MKANQMAADTIEARLIRGLQDMLRQHYGDQNKLTFRDGTCYVRNLRTKSLRSMPNYRKDYHCYLNAFDWLRVPVNMRYAMLERFARERIPVLGGCMYRVTDSDGQGHGASYVLLNLDHSIHRCSPVRTVTDVHIFS